MEKTKYAHRLRDLREDHDYTQDQLVKILAKLYNVSIDFIAGISDEPRPICGENIYSKK